jgi:hypothetical protein
MSTLFISPARSRQVIAAIVAFALVSVFVIRTSDAAFTDEAENFNNEFSTGAISLDEEFSTPLFGDADDGDALFHAMNLVPNEVVDGCIEIDYQGSVDPDNLTEVDLSIAVGGGNGLENDLAVAIEIADNCTAAAIASASGLATNNLVDLDEQTISTSWAPTSDAEVRGFNFVVTVGSDAPMNGEVDGVDLTWSITTTSS